MKGFATGVSLCLVLAACNGGRTIEAYPDELAGIGIVLKKGAGGHVVERLVDGGPAAGAGLKVGDRIVAVDGENVSGKELASVVDALRGREGTDVILNVAGAGGARSVVSVRRMALSRAGGGYSAH